MANGSHISAAQSTTRRAHKWQWLKLASGSLLASSFFTPMMYEKGGAVNPCRDAFALLSEVRQHPPSSVKDTILVGVLLTGLVVPYVIGFFAVEAAIAARCGWRHLTSLCSVLMFAVLTFYCAGALGYSVACVAEYGIREAVGYFEVSLLGLGVLGFLGFVPFLTVGHLLASLRAETGAPPCRAFLGSLLALLWFGTLVLVAEVEGPGALHGACLSLVSSLMLLVAVIGEAAAVTRQSWGQTIRQLLTCRLAAPIDMKGACPGCGYNLYGLTEQRCPECGRAFTFEEIGATPEEMGFRSAG